MQLRSFADRANLSDEQPALRREASLRRIATLAAGGVTPEDLFPAVAREVSAVLDVPVVTVGRYELDAGSPVSVVVASREHASFPVGSRWPLDGAGTREIYEDRSPVRIEDFSGLDGTLASAARKHGLNWVVGAPIIVDGAVWGNIYAGTNGDERIPEDAESRLVEFTDLVSTAIANSEARAKVERLLDEQAALRRVATLVARGASPDDLFSAVAQEVGELFGVGMVNIDRYEEGESVVLASFADPGFPVGSRWPLDGGGVRTLVWETGRPARVDDFADVPGEAPAAARSWGIKSAVAVPIVVNGKVWGVLGFGSKEDEPLPAWTEQRLAAFTELVSTAIANAESRGELAASEARARELADEQAALRRVATRVAAGTSADELFALVCEEVGRLFDAAVAIGRFEAGASELVVVGLAAEEPPIRLGMRLQLDDSLVAAAVLRTGRPARREGRQVVNGAVSTVAAPIVMEGTLWGVIAVNDMRRTLPPDTEERVGKFTELIATAIANAESRAELAASEARSRELANEQSALRRVATLVAGAPPSEQFFSAVAREVASVLNVPGVLVERFGTDGRSVSVGAAYDSDLSGAERVLGVGSRTPPDPGSLTAQVFQTHRTARVEDFSALAGSVGARAHAAGLGSGCAGPILVHRELWGMLAVFSQTGTVLPFGTENRLHDFIELLETAIANYEARGELAASEARARQLAEEQAALRRVATLVAQGASPDEVFSAVAEEVAEVMGIPTVGIRRYETDGTFTILGNVGDISPELIVGSRWPINEGITGTILATGRPARRDLEKISNVAAPILVDGSIWGLVSAADKSGTPLPDDTEERLARFTELIATAISNANTRAELVASRARVVSAADETRRRIERDLHDGIQQSLVALALRARKAAGLSSDGEAAVHELSGLADDLVAVTDELREISRGIHPAILSDAGLDEALKALARRSAIRVHVDVAFQGRYDPTLEATVYYVAAESITNAVKHAQASTVTVRGGRREGSIELEISDDGDGGADPRRGTGLIGLKDRVDSLGGAISFTSPPGAGTTVRMKLTLVPSDAENPRPDGSASG